MVLSQSLFHDYLSISITVNAPSAEDTELVGATTIQTRSKSKRGRARIPKSTSGAIEVYHSIFVILVDACESSESLCMNSSLTLYRCYWWPLQSSEKHGEDREMGLNTNNMDPDLLKYVDRKIDYAVLKVPVRAKDAAHAEDHATY